MSTKRRKVDAKCRAFNEEWENKYFFEQTAQSASIACRITFIIFVLKILVNHVFDLQRFCCCI